jgi:hypothetical protein
MREAILIIIIAVSVPLTSIYIKNERAKMQNSCSQFSGVQEELEIAKAERDVAKASKHEILKDNIELSVRLNEIPTIDLTFSNPTEIEQAYIELAEEREVSVDQEGDYFIKLREDVESKGQACNI